MKVVEVELKVYREKVEVFKLRDNIGAVCMDDVEAVQEEGLNTTRAQLTIHWRVLGVYLTYQLGGKHVTT